VCEQRKEHCHYEKVATPITNYQNISVCTLNGKPWTQESEKMSSEEYKSTYDCYYDEKKPTCTDKNIPYETNIYNDKQICVPYVDQYDCSYYKQKKIPKYCSKVVCSPYKFAFQKDYISGESHDTKDYDAGESYNTKDYVSGESYNTKDYVSSESYSTNDHISDESYNPKESGVTA
jgi:hypothetical protein